MESWWSVRLGDIIAIILLTITIGVIFLVSSLDRRADVNHKKKIACESIKQEIQDTRQAFEENSKYELIKRGNNVSYRLAFLYLDAYESLIHSGIYLEFNPETQTELTDLYTAIKFRNTKLEELGHYHVSFFMNDTSDERKNRWNDERTTFEIAITDHEKFIKEQLNSVEKLMDQEMP